MLQEPGNVFMLIMGCMIYRGLAVFCVTGIREESQRGS